jgi:hypothetical protein
MKYVPSFYENNFSGSLPRCVFGTGFRCAFAGTGIELTWLWPLVSKVNEVTSNGLNFAIGVSSE